MSIQSVQSCSCPVVNPGTAFAAPALGADNSLAALMPLANNTATSATSNDVLGGVYYMLEQIMGLLQGVVGALSGGVSGAAAQPQSSGGVLDTMLGWFEEPLKAVGSSLIDTAGGYLNQGLDYVMSGIGSLFS